MIRFGKCALLTQRRGCWIAKWNNDGTRSIKKEHMILKEEWKNGKLLYTDINGVEVKDNPEHIDSEWSVGKIVIEKGSGDIWDRTAEGRYLSRATGFVETRPHPRNTPEAIYLPFTSNNDGAYDECRIRIEKGPIMEYCERIRDFLCHDMNKKYEKLILPSDTVMEMLGEVSDVVSIKITQVNNLLSGSIEEHDTENAAIALIHLLNIISTKTAFIDSSNVFRRTHVMTLSYNPLSGLFPLYNCKQSTEFLSKGVYYFSGYENLRGISTIHKQYSTLSESLISSHISQRRALSDPHYYVQDKNNIEKAAMLQVSSQTHNYFLFWSTVIPGGCKLGSASNSNFLEVVMNGVFGNFDHFRQELREKSAAIETGWLWLAIDITRKKKISQGLKKFERKKKEKKNTDINLEARDIVVREKVDVVLGSVTEVLTGRVVGYDFQILCTQEDESPVSYGYYPLACLPIQPSLITSKRSRSQYVDDWLKVINWRVVDFQLRTCFKSIVPTEYTDHFPKTSSPHAVWIDLLCQRDENDKIQRVAEYQTARSQLESNSNPDDWFSSEHVKLEMSKVGEVASEKTVIQRTVREAPVVQQTRNKTIDESDTDIVLSEFDDDMEPEMNSTEGTDTKEELLEEKEEPHIGDLPRRGADENLDVTDQTKPSNSVRPTREEYESAKFASAPVPQPPSAATPPVPQPPSAATTVPVPPLRQGGFPFPLQIVGKPPAVIGKAPEGPVLTPLPPKGISFDPYQSSSASSVHKAPSYPVPRLVVGAPNPPNFLNVKSPGVPNPPNFLNVKSPVPNPPNFLNVKSPVPNPPRSNTGRSSVVHKAPSYPAPRLAAGAPNPPDFLNVKSPNVPNPPRSGNTLNHHTSGSSVVHKAPSYPAPRLAAGAPNPPDFLNVKNPGVPNPPQSKIGNTLNHTHNLFNTIPKQQPASEEANDFLEGGQDLLMRQGGKNWDRKMAG